MSVPRVIDPNYVATLEAHVERLEEDNEDLRSHLKWAIRVVKTNEAVMAELHERLAKMTGEGK